MRRTSMVMISITVLLCCAAALLSDVPANVQSVMDKEANELQLTSVEKEILFGYLDEMNARTEWELDEQWGPGCWGYVAQDPASGGDPYSWIDISTTGTEIWNNENQDDTWSDSIAIGFSFPFYDSTFSNFYISANMLVKFSMDYVSYSNPIPSTSYPYRVDPWTYDMYHLTTSDYYYQTFAANPGDVDTLVVSFIDGRYYSSTYRNDPTYGKTMQVLLFSDGKIKLQYNSLLNIITGSPYTSGIDDNYGPYGLSCGNSFSDGYAVTFFPPAPGIILCDPMVTPEFGNATTVFTYNVFYRNTAGTAPTTLEVWIDGSVYTMNNPGGDYTMGVTLDYGPITHTVGSHDYYFNFGDGTYTSRSPETGTYSGPDVYGSLAGSYDVGGGSLDFPDLVSVSQALIAGGITGPCTFNVYTGTYDGQIDLPAVSGSSVTNTITFQNAVGQSPVVTSSSGHGFNFTGADYVTITGFEITDCYYNGIYNYYSGTDYSTNNQFIGNYIHNVGSAGSYSGIYLNYGDDCVVMGNEIEGDYYGIYNNYGDRNLIANNMVYNTEYYGIRAYYGYDNEYYYNSVLTGYYYTMYKYYGYNTTVVNNIFYNTHNTTAYAYYISGTLSTYTMVSDYNDIYAPNGANVGYYNGACATLAAFQTATAMDANSISVDPFFVATDTPDLHISTIFPSAVDGAGTPVAITTDFDLDTRDATTPDIGADEFDYSPFEYTVVMEPDEYTFTSDPNNEVDYYFYVSNFGSLNDVYDITVNVTGVAWVHTVYDYIGATVIDSLAINAGAVDSFLVRVTVPIGGAYPDYSNGEVIVSSRYGTDNILSDTSTTTTSANMVGTYDVGGGSMDFADLVSVSNILSTTGVGGAVTIEVYTGTYNGQVNLPAIPGSGPTNTTTFTNAVGESPVVTSTSGHGFFLNGADYVTIKGLEITDCYYNGIYNYYSGSDYSTYNRYIGNHIHGVGTGGSYSGIYLYNADDCIAVGNEIEGDYYGIYNNYGDRCQIINNMVYNTEYYGIRAYYGTDNEYYYNSLLTGYYYTMYKYYGTNTTVVNNIFYNNYAGTAYAYYIYGTLTSYPLISDYNDIYAPNGANLGYYNGAHTTLAAFQAATGLDANSISADPGFVATDTPDLHILSYVESPVDSMGTPIGAADFDFDGDMRDPVTPDIGADEFTFQPLDYCVDLTPDLQEGLAGAGDTVDFQVTIDNCGALNDTYDLSVNVTGATWTHEIRDAAGASIISTISVNAGMSDAFMVRVYADVGGVVGDTSFCEVTAQSQNTPRNIYSDACMLQTMISPYTTIPFDWVEIAGPMGGPGTDCNISGDDANGGPFDIGFNFPFYDCEVFDQIRVCSNGFASFTSTSTDYSNDPIPYSVEPNNLLAAYWDDLTTSSQGSIWYYYDSANDRFIVEWYDVPQLSGTSSLTFELILYPDGTIDYMYQTLTLITLNSCTVGIENGTGTVGYQTTYNGSGPLEPVSGLGVRFQPVCIPTYGSVSGTITLDGAVGDITNVVVEENGVLHRMTNPDITGFYMLDSVMTGTRTITASLPIYFYTNSATGVVVVEDDTTEDVDITLRRLEPAVPTGLAGDVEFSTGANTLTWDAHPDGTVDLFHLQRMPDGGSWADIGTVSASVQTMMDTLPAWGTYYYRIAASDTNVVPPPSMSDWSDPLAIVWGVFPPVNLSANGFYDDRIRLTWQSPGYEEPPTILVVDDDGSVNNGGTYTAIESIFFTALDDAGYTYDTFIVDWSITSPPQDGPTALEMADYDIVIWFGGETWGYYGADVLTANDETNLAAYLGGGGNFFLSAQDYFYACYPGASSFTTGQFPYDYLGVSATTQDYWSSDVTWAGGTGSLAAGMTFNTLNPFPGSSAMYADALTTSGTDLLLNTALSGANQYDAGSFKIVFTTVSFAGLVDGTAPNTKAQLMDNIINFFTGSRDMDMVSAPSRPTVPPQLAYNPASRTASEVRLSKEETSLLPKVQNSGYTPMDLGQVIRNTRNEQELQYETDQSIEYFKVYRDGSYLDSTSALEYFDIGLAENIDHDYYVTAWYDVGIESDPSDTVTERCNMAPAAPSNFTGAPSGNDMVLTWDDPTTNWDGTACVDLTTLKIYREGAYLADVAPGVQTYTDTPPTINDFYTWTIEAQDEVPNTSAQAQFIGAVDAPFEVIPYDWVEINPARPGAIPGGINTGIIYDDDNVGPFGIGFSFPFYDCVTFDSIRVCSNGWASFTSTSTEYWNDPIPTALEPNNLLAPYFDDMNPSNYGSVWYLYDATNDRFIVEWDSLAQYSYNGVWTFELILYPNGTIHYQYKELTPGNANNATVGIENATGTAGLQCTYNGSGPINPTPGMGIRIDPVCIPVVQVVITLTTGTDVDHAVLSWDDVGAAQYHVYKSDNPTSGFTLLGSTTTTQYTDTNAVTGNVKAFYYVTTEVLPVDR